MVVSKIEGFKRTQYDGPVTAQFTVNELTSKV